MGMAIPKNCVMVSLPKFETHALWLESTASTAGNSSDVQPQPVVPESGAPKLLSSVKIRCRNRGKILGDVLLRIGVVLAPSCA